MIQQYTTVSIAQLLLLGNKKSGNTPNKKFYIQRAKQETFRTKTDTRKVTQNEAKIVTVIREVTWKHLLFQPIENQEKEERN